MLTQDLTLVPIAVTKEMLSHLSPPETYRKTNM